MRIGLLINAFGSGGVERTLTNLAAGLARLDQQVDLLTSAPDHSYARMLPAAVRLWPLIGPSQPALAEYLSQAQPDILFTGKLDDDRTALAVCRPRRQSSHVSGDPPSGPLGGRFSPRLVATVGTPLTVRAAQGGNPLKAFWKRRQIAADYRQLDAITAVSEAVATDLHRLDLGSVPVRILCNPVIPDDLEARLDPVTPAPHPWLADQTSPVIVAVGGLRRVKDFRTLLRAVSHLQAAPAVRLLILGEGRQRRRLTLLAERLGIGSRIALPGFVADPYPWIARARLLALSSRREGLGNVLVEAMALGIPVVATDCPGGVRGLLADGQLGRLVPIGDHRALARAISRTLADPPDPASLRQQAAPYRIGAAAAAYLAFFEELVAQRCRNI